MSTTAAQQSGSSSSGAYGFASGFLLGQLTLAFILFLFIKFFIFGEPPSADVRAATRASHRRQRTLSHSSHLQIQNRKRRQSGSSSSSNVHRKSSLLGLNAPATRIGGPVNNTLTTEQILAKTYYNVDGHQPESLDWFNVLIAQTIAQLRADALQDNAVLDSLTSALNGPGKPDFVDEIRVTDISLGEEFPIFSNCRVIPVDENGAVLSTNTGGQRGGAGPARGERVGESRLQAQMDVDLGDVLTLGIETKLVLNFPKPFSAVLPVALVVSVVRFSGTLSLSFTPSQGPPPASESKSSEDEATSGGGAAGAGGGPSTTRSPTTLTFTFLDDYRLDLSVHSLIGSRSRLQDVPKIAQLVEQRIHNWFDERCVEPRFQQIVLPSLWPRKKNVRGGGEDGAEVGAGGSATTAGTAGLTSPTSIPASVSSPAKQNVKASASAQDDPFISKNNNDASSGLNAPSSMPTSSTLSASSSSSSRDQAAENAQAREDPRTSFLRRRKSGNGDVRGRRGPGASAGMAGDHNDLELAGAEMREAEERERARGSAFGRRGVGAMGTGGVRRSETMR